MGNTILQWKRGVKWWLGAVGAAASIGLIVPWVLSAFGARDPRWWLWWEVLAAPITAVYSIVYYCQMFNELEDVKGIKERKQLRLWLSLIGVVFCLLMLFVGVSLLFSPPPLAAASRAGLYLLTMIYFLTYDYLISDRAEESKIKRRFQASFYFVEIPATCAFAVILFLAVRECYSVTHCPGEIDVFVSGAVAFELLAGTTCFAFVHDTIW